MKPLIVLVVTFLLSLSVTQLFNSTWNYVLAGNIAMAVMLLFTAMGHFMFTEGMAMMLPGFIPSKREVVLLTGAIEIGAAVSLLIPGLRYPVSILLIIFFILILPANINAAWKNIDYQTATYDGHGINYLWFRVPLQLLFIAWVWLFNVKLR